MSEPTDHLAGGPSDGDDFGFRDGSWMSRLGAAIAPGASPGDAEAANGANGAARLGAIGEYELLERLGAGGQGVVYKARQPRTGRLVAIKRVALADGHDERSRARFLREVELAASLRAEGIVTIHEVLADASAVVMQLVDGQPADAWADGVRAQPGAAPIRRIAETARAASSAVAFAHGRGVIHRDLKPSNILIDAEGRPHILDFGLARETGAPEATLTIAGSFAGTPAYAPPEQLDRGLHEVDVRADVYAMGAVLYRMLTGREPFQAPTLAALFDAVRRGRPPEPVSLEPRIDRELGDITLMALRPRPEDRYQTMADFADDLGRWLDRRAVRARAPTPVYLARALVRRHPLGAALTAAALAAICALAAAAGISAIRLAGERDRLATTLSQRDTALAEARASQERATMELYKSRASVEALFRVLQDLPDEQEEVVEALQRQLARLDNPPLPLRPEIELGNRIALARALGMMGRSDLAGPAAQGAVAMARRQGLGGADLAEALALAGQVALEEGRYDEAIEAIGATLEIHDAGLESGESVWGHMTMLEALGAAGRHAEAQAFANSMPENGGPTRPFVAGRVRELCGRFGLTAPGWAADDP